MGLEARLPTHARLHLSPWRSSAGCHNLDLWAKQADKIFHLIMFVLQSLPLPTVIPAGPRELFFSFFFLFGETFIRGNKPKGCFGETLRIKGGAERDAFFTSMSCFILLRQACVLIFSLFLS